MRKSHGIEELLHCVTQVQNLDKKLFYEHNKYTLSNYTDMSLTVILPTAFYCPSPPPPTRHTHTHTQKCYVVEMFSAENFRLC